MAKNNDFYNKVSANCNFVDPKVTEDVYYAIIRTILQGLKKEGEINLPEFGKFSITEYKEHKMNNIYVGVITVPVKKVLKFAPFYKLRHYIGNKM